MDAIGIAAASLVLSVVAILITVFYSYKSKKQKDASLDFEIHKILNDAELTMYETGESSKLDKYDQARKQLCNVYELACSMYLDGKIDKKNFKEMYFQQIEALCSKDEEKSSFVDIFYPEKGNCVYSSIFKVYKEVHCEECVSKKRKLLTLPNTPWQITRVIVAIAGVVAMFSFLNDSLSFEKFIGLISFISFIGYLLDGLFKNIEERQ